MRDENRDWDEILGQLPPAVPALQPAELICVVELAGEAASVQARIDAVRQVIEAAANCQLGDGLRVGLVGYGDHPSPRSRSEGPYLEWPLGPAAEAIAELAAWEALRLPVRNRYLAPAEDALNLAAGVAWAAPRRVIVIAAKRSPYPPGYRRAADLPGCINHLDWAELTQRLMREGIKILAITDQADWTGLPAQRRSAVASWAADQWALVSGRFDSADFDPGQVIAEAGLGGFARSAPVTLAAIGEPGQIVREESQ